MELVNLLIRFVRFGFMGVIFILFSCTQKQESRINEPLYFNINSLIEEQTKTLASINPSVKKKLNIDLLEQKKEFKNIDWKEELKIFKEGDINSPVLRETYNTDKTDERDIYKIKYTPKKPLKKGVAELRISFYKKNSHIKDIYFKLISDNLLYTSERNFYLTFINKNNKSLLKTYRIRNYQDIIFKRPIETTLFTEIIYSSALL